MATISLDRLLENKENPIETFRNIRGEQVRFLEGIPEDAECQISLHLRKDIWNSIVFGFFHEMGYLPNHKGMPFEKACGYLGPIMNVTRCWVEDYKGYNPERAEEKAEKKEEEEEKKTAEEAGKPLPEPTVSKDRLCARLQNCLKQSKEGKVPITIEEFYRILGELETGKIKKRFSLVEELEEQGEDGQRIKRTSRIPIYSSLTQSTLLHNKVIREIELMRDISYNEITLAYLHAKKEIKRHMGYAFEEASKQHSNMIDATYYILEEPLKKQNTDEAKEKLAKIYEKKEAEKRMVGVMGIDLGINRRNNDFETIEEIYQIFRGMIESPKPGQQAPQYSAFTEAVNVYYKTLEETSSLIELPLETRARKEDERTKSELEQITLDRETKEEQIKEMINYFTSNSWKLA